MASDSTPAISVSPRFVSELQNVFKTLTRKLKRDGFPVFGFKREAVSYYNSLFQNYPLLLEVCLIDLLLQLWTDKQVRTNRADFMNDIISCFAYDLCENLCNPVKLSLRPLYNRSASYTIKKKPHMIMHYQGARRFMATLREKHEAQHALELDVQEPSPKQSEEPTPILTHFDFDDLSNPLDLPIDLDAVFDDVFNSL